MLSWGVAGAAVLILTGITQPVWGATARANVQQATVAAASLVLDGVTVADVEQGKLVPSQRVVIAGNRIQAIGGAGAVSVPNGARVVDAQGKYLIPGLWDLHVHTSDSSMQSLLLASGVTGVRDAFSGIPLETLIQWRREVLAGTRAAPPRQILSGAGIDEEEGCSRSDLTGHTCVIPADTADARRVVDTLKAAGADMIKMYDLSRETYFAIAAAARRRGIEFGGHLGGHLGQIRAGSTVASAFEASDSGARIIDHVNSSGGMDTLCFGPKATVDRCRPVADRFRRNNTWWVSTLIHRITVNPSAEPRPGDASDSVAARYTDASEQFASGAAVKTDWLHGAVKVGGGDSLRFLAAADRAGLPILAGTDASGSQAGFRLHAELSIYVTEGMTPLHALQTATLNPAKMLHATDSLGTVAVGKLADLVLLDADPLADITNTTAIRAVVANGRYFDRAALDKLLASSHGD
jgi:hypothetical protein